MVRLVSAVTKTGTVLSKLVVKAVSDTCKASCVLLSIKISHEYPDLNFALPMCIFVLLRILYKVVLN